MIHVFHVEARSATRSIDMRLATCTKKLGQWVKSRSLIGALLRDKSYPFAKDQNSLLWSPVSSHPGGTSWRVDNGFMCSCWHCGVQMLLLCQYR
ncbi:hypothetical protein VFPPC_15293 [Pochonia chlamydosporia 170]|uniref:Uncharacterized protein n=1 Tax=Pochonia chlamydosporia 170 TaxID=1380566 RepID=A0A179G6A7_METCM|nr:hypothetical protein VFPPC_15293 [Pochonia chlamydosporia 170]OAQ73357.1 hypothetical protein VFPPC_15293 [Pochonia chlamydosporia 170]